MLKNVLRRTFMGGMLGLGGAAAAMAAVGSPVLAQERQGRGRVNTPGGLAGLFLARQGRRRRESSWNRDGRNADRYQIEPGATHVMADLRGAGIIRHIWVTINDQEPDYLRKLVLRPTGTARTNRASRRRSATSSASAMDAYRTTGRCH